MIPRKKLVIQNVCALICSKKEKKKKKIMEEEMVGETLGARIVCSAKRVGGK